MANRLDDASPFDQSGRGTTAHAAFRTSRLVSHNTGRPRLMRQMLGMGLARELAGNALTAINAAKLFERDRPAMLPAASH